MKAHGTQCGFCTPGFVMSMYTLLRNNTRPSELEIQRAITGSFSLHGLSVTFLFPRGKFHPLLLYTIELYQMVLLANTTIFFIRLID